MSMKKQFKVSQAVETSMNSDQRREEVDNAQANAILPEIIRMQSLLKETLQALDYKLKHIAEISSPLAVDLSKLPTEERITHYKALCSLAKALENWEIQKKNWEDPEQKANFGEHSVAGLADQISQYSSSISILWQTYEQSQHNKPALENNSLYVEFNLLEKKQRAVYAQTEAIQHRIINFYEYVKMAGLEAIQTKPSNNTPQPAQQMTEKTKMTVNLLVSPALANKTQSKLAETTKEIDSLLERAKSFNDSTPLKQLQAWQDDHQALRKKLEQDIEQGEVSLSLDLMTKLDDLNEISLSDKAFQSSLSPTKI